MQGNCMEVGGTQQKAFDELTRRFVEGPILVATDYNAPFTCGVRCFRFCNTGAVLSMLCEDEKWHLCAFLSKRSKRRREKYNVHDKEMLGIIWGAWSMEALSGGGKAWNWRMDWSSKSQVLYDRQKLNRWQVRWAAVFSHDLIFTLHTKLEP